MGKMAIKIVTESELIGTCLQSPTGCPIVASFTDQGTLYQLPCNRRTESIVCRKLPPSLLPQHAECDASSSAIAQETGIAVPNSTLHNSCTDVKNPTVGIEE